MRYLLFSIALLLTFPVKAFELYSGVPFYDGKNIPVTLESFAGKPILLFVWKKKCAGCRTMLPKLDEFYLKHHSNIKILPVMTSAPTLSDARKIYTDSDIKYLPIYMDITGYFAEKAGITATPTVIIYNKKGDAVFHGKGQVDLSSPDFQTNLNTLINE